MIGLNIEYSTSKIENMIIKAGVYFDVTNYDININNTKITYTSIHFCA